MQGPLVIVFIVWQRTSTNDPLTSLSFFLSFFLSGPRDTATGCTEKARKRERERQREEKIETGNKGMSRKRVAGVEAAPESTQP